MLAFEPQKEEQSAVRSCVPNILPCRIHHNGIVNASDRYWKPQDKADGTQEAYFRGRKLEGRKVTVPTGYRGVLVDAKPNADQQKPNASSESAFRSRDFEDVIDLEGEEADDVQTLPEGTLSETSQFDHFVVWGHDRRVEDDDSFVKGAEEWIAFSKAIHQPGKANASSRNDA